jgi:PAS domain S-box-containing protein
MRLSDLEAALARGDVTAADLAGALPTAAFAVGSDGVLQWWSDRFADVTGYGDDALRDRRFVELLPPADAERVGDVLDRVREHGGTATPRTHVVTAADDPWPVSLRVSRLDAYGDGALLGVVRDDPGRVETDPSDHHERKVAASRDELRTLVRINAVVQEVIGALVTAASRDEIEETVCERLQESALYQSAWIGEPDPSGEGIVPRVGVGVSDRFLDQVPEMDASREWDGPASRALATGDIQVIGNLVEAEDVPEPVRAEGLARGVRSVVSVPLSHGDTVYGFLTVGATRPDAFSEREQSAFEVLGEVIGFAINAVQSKQLLLSDATTELEFRTSDDDSVVVRASAAASCRLTLDGMVPVGDGTLLCYASVSGADPSAVVSAVQDADGVEDARAVSEGSDRSVVELAVSGESVMHALTQRGAHVQSMEAEDGQATLTVAVAPGVDVRSLVKHVQSTFPDLRLVAKQEMERSRRDTPVLRRALDDRLTERQRAALRAAYHGGYFDWPRGSTAEDLADAMGISSPTFHQHLRAAQRKLLSVFLDVEAGDGTS